MFLIEPNLSFAAMWETQVQSLDQEDPLKKGMATHSIFGVFLPGESMDRGAWWAIVHGVTKRPTTTEELKLLLFSPLYNHAG